LLSIYQFTNTLKGEKALGAKKIKVDKKRTDKAEEILSAFDQAKIWAEEHSTLVSAVVVVVLLVPLVFWGFSAYGESKERKAREAYAQAVAGWPEQDTGDAKTWEEIIPKLQKCMEEHSGTKAALDARLDMARAFFHVGRYEDAAKGSSQVIEQAEVGSGLRPLARYQLALAYEMLGKTDEALAQWEALQKEQLSGLKREVDWRLAALYTKKEQYAKAVAHYEEALSAPGAYPSAPLLQEELAFAKTKTGTAGDIKKEEPPKPQNPG
jgi:predicted negative regulator of RcsB-dependent stress response